MCTRIVTSQKHILKVDNRSNIITRPSKNYRPLIPLTKCVGGPVATLYTNAEIAAHIIACFHYLGDNQAI